MMLISAWQQSNSTSNNTTAEKNKLSNINIISATLLIQPSTNLSELQAACISSSNQDKLYTKQMIVISVKEKDAFQTATKLWRPTFSSQWLQESHVNILYSKQQHAVQSHTNVHHPLLPSRLHTLLQQQALLEVSRLWRKGEEGLGGSTFFFFLFLYIQFTPHLVHTYKYHVCKLISYQLCREDPQCTSMQIFWVRQKYICTLIHNCNLSIIITSHLILLSHTSWHLHCIYSSMHLSYISIPHINTSTEPFKTIFTMTFPLQYNNTCTATFPLSYSFLECIVAEMR